MKNVFNKSFCIFCHYKLGYLIDITYNNCFLANNQFALNVTIFLLSLY